jgi:hypothetical protein
MLEKYRTLNNSFKKKLVFNLGSEAGFFSEYNNMILAILYCLKHKIKFELYSSDANFRFNEGWEDYFLEFCSKTTYKSHAYLNNRQPLIWVSLGRKIKTKLFKWMTNTNYLTFELWNLIHNREFEKEWFAIPELNINADLNQACRIIDKMIWRYNKRAQMQIDKLIESLLLPSEYVGFHIRGGDKFIEHQKKEIDTYIIKATKFTLLKNAFVLTDDYRVITELKEKYPYWTFYTLCQESEQGYFHADFNCQSNEVKSLAHYRLFASIDVLANSKLFVGTFSSNPGMYLGIRMELEKVKCVDYDNWMIW